MRTIIRAIVGLGIAALLEGCGGSSSSGSSLAPPRPPLTGGLDARPANATCIAPSRNGAGTSIALERVFADLAFEQPLAMLQAPGDDSRWFVLEKPGRVRVFENQPNVSAFDADFISLTVNDASEGGLLGMAFDPDFATNGQVFLSWTEGPPLVSVVARFTSTNGGMTLDPGSRQDIIRVNQPAGNHNGGQIAFGPDGFLYLGLGDGGSGGDPDGHAQDTTDLLGTFLRLDVDSAMPYAIPSGNPFAGNPVCPADHTSTQNCPEIYAWGLRNPWRWSFDSQTQELWVGDVGQGTFEEVDRVELGGNYGWDCREGSDPYVGPPDAPAASCSTASGLVDPVHQYPRSEGTSITGGYVYRGAALPALTGSYVFGDFGSGRIWRLVDDAAGGFTAEELLGTALSIASFGVDDDGELYVVDIAGGTLHRVIDGGGGAPAGPPVAAVLSDTGCMDAQDPAQPASGLIPYQVAAPFWSDGADKERWLAIPDGTTVAVGADGDFSFPNGTVLVKHFRVNGELIETRLFMRHPDGEWAGYTYEWDDQQSDAMLVQGGKTADIGGQDWTFPSGNECLSCHTAAAGFSLGLETAELNHDFTYPSTGRTANQLSTLDEIVLFDSPLGDPSVQPALADPYDASFDLDARARAYLHTNCSQCHRPNGPAPSSLDLRFSTALDNTNACDVQPQAGDLGIGAGARIIAPGAPADSVLRERMNRRDATAMPPLASNLVDSAGVMLIGDWIASLAGCL
jgi:uncharacterized repeat protein (TIGR03806 family)